MNESVEDIVARIALQKSSREMSFDEIEGADWQDGFDFLLADVRKVIRLISSEVAGHSLLERSEQR